MQQHSISSSCFYWGVWQNQQRNTALHSDRRLDHALLARIVKQSASINDGPGLRKGVREGGL